MACVRAVEVTETEDNSRAALPAEPLGGALGIKDGPIVFGRSEGNGFLYPVGSLVGVGRGKGLLDKPADLGLDGGLGEES